jgi:hypothetical protein
MREPLLSTPNRVSKPSPHRAAFSQSDLLPHSVNPSGPRLRTLLDTAIWPRGRAAKVSASKGISPTSFQIGVGYRQG